MLLSIKSILEQASSLIDKFNSTPVKRLIVYAMIIYPLALAYIYQEEVKLVLTSLDSELVTIPDLAKAQERCFELRVKYNAAAVSMYLYQPASKNKNYKERAVFSSGNQFVPLPQTKYIQLASRSRILEELKTSSYVKITAMSDHHESAIVQANDLKYIIITPINDVVTDQIIGEVWWTFIEPSAADIKILNQEGQFFAYNITE